MSRDLFLDVTVSKSRNATIINHISVMHWFCISVTKLIIINIISIITVANIIFKYSLGSRTTLNRWAPVSILYTVG